MHSSLGPARFASYVAIRESAANRRLSQPELMPNLGFPSAPVRRDRLAGQNFIIRHNSIYRWLVAKYRTFRRVTGTRKSLFLTFVTAHGLAPGDYVSELVANEVSGAALFEP